ncbi:hypothetical protein EZS27_004785 [termite gut metagenome]|uniref:Uncharacterized protein n=1 Tax=termite gut metagenome TaxID=433724 RepID=A0A5J4SQU0_9ZZZZ
MKQKQFKVKLTKSIVTLFVFLAVMTVNAQEVSVGTDVVSNYIWRGTYGGGVSIQPSISVAQSGFSLTAWGSVGLESTDTKEFDLTLGYGIGGFSVALTDYWFDTLNNRYFKYAAHSTAHVYEATLGYDFGIFSLSWNTNFAGSDYYTKESSERSYSTYAEAVVPFKLGGYDFTAEVGLTPWEGFYSNKLNLTNIGLKATKNIVVTESFTIPAFAKVVLNPNSEQAYFVFGITF